MKKQQEINQQIGKIMGSVEPIVSKMKASLRPDEAGHFLLLFSNYVGKVENDVANSSIGIIDINESSPTYLEVLSWVVNR